MNEPNYEVAPVEPVEGPGTEIAKILNDGDPVAMLDILEKKAQLAPRMAAALNTILMSQTYPEDWTSFGSGDTEKICLSSAGAERVARLFDISIFDVTHKKEEWTDEHGAAYRYVYECRASLGSRVTYAQGNYSTRDKLLGSVNKKWKPIEDINEGHIRNAAYHILMGNAVKALLGLRGMSRAQFDKIMSGAGADPSKATNVSHASGSQGGTTTDDTAKQANLMTACSDIAHAGKFVEKKGKIWHLCELTTAMAELEDVELAMRICCELSSFPGKGGEIVPGKPEKELHGQRLDITTSTACKLQGTL